MSEGYDLRTCSEEFSRRQRAVASDMPTAVEINSSIRLLSSAGVYPQKGATISTVPSGEGGWTVWCGRVEGSVFVPQVKKVSKWRQNLV